MKKHSCIQLIMVTVLFVLFIFVTSNLLFAQYTVTNPIKLNESIDAVIDLIDEIIIYDPCLWQLDTNNTTMYFFGSIHLGNEKMYPLPQKIMDAFQASSQLIVEVNLLEYDLSSLGAIIVEKGMYPADDSLENYLTEEEINRLVSMFEPMGVPRSQLLRFKPWLIQLMLIGTGVQNTGNNASNEQLQADLGLDLYFLNQANELKIEISQLESAEEQIDFFAGLDEESQIDQLRQQLIGEGPQSQLIGNTLLEMADIWMQGDEQAMIRVIIDQYQSTEIGRNQYDLLFVQRNRNWIPKLEALIQQGGNYFVVVGLGHLIGDDSLIRMLRDNGYIIERI